MNGLEWNPTNSGVRVDAERPGPKPSLLATSVDQMSLTHQRILNSPVDHVHEDLPAIVHCYPGHSTRLPASGSHPLLLIYITGSS